jgi:hypothetical protein
LPILSMLWRGAHGLMWGTRGPFSPAAAMVGVVKMPFVFVLRLLENAIKTLNYLFVSNVCIYY